MSKATTLDGVIDYANRLVQREVMEIVVVDTPYDQTWKWHSPLPKPFRELFSNMDEEARNNLRAFEAALPPEAFIPDTLIFATNFEVDFLFYTAFYRPDAEIVAESHAIQIDPEDRMRVRKHAKLHKLPHAEFPLINLPVRRYGGKVSELFTT